MVKSRMRTLVVGLLCVSWSVSVAHAAPPAGTSRQMLAFAPSATDIIFCADIQSLAAFLQDRGPEPSAVSSIYRLQELRGGLGLESFEKLQLGTVCTFHLRGTDQQLVVFEVVGALPAWVKQFLANQGGIFRSRGGREFLLFSKTQGLAQRFASQRTSGLSSPMNEAASELMGERYWTVVDVSQIVRDRLQGTTGSKRNLPEIQGLQLIQFKVGSVASNDITLEMCVTYSSEDEASELGSQLGRWLPFEHRPSEPSIEGAQVTFTIPHVSFAELDRFLSHF